MSGPGTIEMLPKNRNEWASRKLALSLNCVTEKQWKSELFWADRGNVSAVLKCLEGWSAERLAAILPALETEGIYFHGLATEIGPNGVINWGGEWMGWIVADNHGLLPKLGPTEPPETPSPHWHRLKGVPGCPGGSRRGDWPSERIAPVAILPTTDSPVELRK
jgi:hypothetical protein